MDQINIPFIVHVDLSKAFNIIHDAILLMKLYYYEIHRHYIIYGIIIFLEDINNVDYNGFTSTATGVVKGSISGLLFFLMEYFQNVYVCRIVYGTINEIWIQL